MEKRYQDGHWVWLEREGSNSGSFTIYANNLLWKTIESKHILYSGNLLFSTQTLHHLLCLFGYNKFFFSPDPDKY